MKKWSYTRLEDVSTINYFVIKHKIYKIMRRSEAKTQILDIRKENIKSNYKNLSWNIYFTLQKFKTIEEAENKRRYSTTGTIYDEQIYDENGYYKTKFLNEPFKTETLSFTQMAVY